MDEPCVVAVGLQWGDEGKGKIIDWLATDAQHVARFQGGHNAGHTIIAEGRELVLHLVPSGILQPNCHCYIGQGVVLDLAALLDEIDRIREFGVDITKRLTISPDCALLLPFHQALDEARESGNGKIGTTKRGIGPAHEDKVGRRAVRLRHVLGNGFTQRLQDATAHANCELIHLHGAAPFEATSIASLLREQADAVRPYVGGVAAPLVQARACGEKILLEASQGALLDIEQGSYPYVTSAHSIAAAAVPGLGIDLKPMVLGIAKCYSTRVGHGAFPTELDGAAAQLLTTEGQEFGATTARQRRVGWIDIPALKHALAINGCQDIALTKLDVLGLLDEINVCTNYSSEGSTHAKHWSPDNQALKTCLPQYREHPGWGALESVSTYADLPELCREYVCLISELTGARIRIVSHGKEREHTLLCS